MYEGAEETLLGLGFNASDQLINHRLYYYETREELITDLPSILHPGDTILVKASHFMGFENVVKSLL